MIFCVLEVDCSFVTWSKSDKLLAQDGRLLTEAIVQKWRQPHPPRKDGGWKLNKTRWRNQYISETHKRSDNINVCKLWPLLNEPFRPFILIEIVNKGWLAILSSINIAIDRHVVQTYPTYSREIQQDPPELNISQCRATMQWWKKLETSQCTKTCFFFFTSKCQILLLYKTQTNTPSVFSISKSFKRIIWAT